MMSPLRIGLACLALTGAVSCAENSPSPPAALADNEMGSHLLGFDHMPVAVNDLEAAEARFEALGFTIKPGRFHENGIRNGHAKFRDGSYIELITAPEARDELTALYRDHMVQGDGPAFVSLYVRDLAELPDLLAPLGGMAEDGTVVFASEALSAFFFGTRDPSPIDRPEHYVHANGAIALDRAWLAPSQREPVERMFEALGAEFRPEQTCALRCGPTAVAHLPEGEVVILEPRDQRVAGRTIIGATVRVEDLDAVRAALEDGGVAIGGNSVRVRRGSILVPPSLANGMWLEFREE